MDDVPGIGKRIAQFLAESSDLASYKPVYNSYQLFGKFLSFKEPGVTPILHCERFYQWLLEKGVRQNTTEIVQAVAEKTATWIPLIYDGKKRYTNWKSVDYGVLIQLQVQSTDRDLRLTVVG